jgi:hypothetical protein
MTQGPQETGTRVVARGLLEGLLEIALVGVVVVLVLAAAGGIGYAAAGGTGLLVGLGAGVVALGVTWVVLVVSGVATTVRAVVARRPRG